MTTVSSGLITTQALSGAHHSCKYITYILAGVTKEHLSDLTGLVVSTKNCYSLRVPAIAKLLDLKNTATKMKSERFYDAKEYGQRGAEPSF
jgi:hypothetical protein